MLYGDRLAGREDGESIALTDLGGSRGDILDLDTGEVGDSASRVLNGERIGGQLVKDTTRVVEQLERLIAGVGDRGSDLQVVDPVDRLSTRELKLKGGGRRDSDGRSCQSEESGTDRRGEHFGEPRRVWRR